MLMLIDVVNVDGDEDTLGDCFCVIVNDEENEEDNSMLVPKVNDELCIQLYHININLYFNINININSLKHWKGN